MREVEVYENERYIPLSGWSTKGLMMTDRSAYSTEDGSANFASLEEASSQLSSEGASIVSTSTSVSTQLFLMVGNRRSETPLRT